VLHKASISLLHVSSTHFNNRQGAVIKTQAAYHMSVNGTHTHTHIYIGAV